MRISKKIVIAILSLLITFCLSAQKKDTVYSIQFVSAEDGEILPSIHIKMHGIMKWIANSNGIATIKKSDMYGKVILLIAGATGFESLSFSPDTLSVTKTQTIKLKKAPIRFDEIEFISYRVPLIEKDHLSWREKRYLKKFPPKVKDTVICYSEKDVKDYALLLSGKWHVHDSLRNKIVAKPGEWFDYFRKNMNYPKRAYEFEVEDKVYFNFEIDKNGYLQKIKLLKGNPLIALEVFDFLKKTPRLKVERDPWSDAPPRPLEYQLSVSFKLR